MATKGTYRVLYGSAQGGYRTRQVEASSPEEAEARVRAEAAKHGDSVGEPAAVWGYTATLSASIPQLSADGVSASPVAVELSYTTTDPYAVTFTFHDHQRTTWIVGRSLLDAGIHSRPVGIGDLEMTTYAGAAGDITVITFAGPAERVSSVFTTDDLIGFLLITEDMVTPGTETAVMAPALDAWRTQLSDPAVSCPPQGRETCLEAADLDVLRQAAERGAPVLIQPQALLALIGEVSLRRAAEPASDDPETSGRRDE